MRADLSKIVDQELDITYPGGVNVKLDVERVVMEITEAIPGAFSETSYLDNSSSPVPMRKLQASIYFYEEKKPLPSDLPAITQITDSLRRVFRVPESCGTSVVWAAFGVLGEAISERDTIKKNMPALPDLPDTTASTPAT
jgi:hypothetical protein